MFNCILRFFNKEQEQEQTKNQAKTQYQDQIFNKQYRNSYNKLWIQNLRNYYP
jgi:hypothetical protein